MQGLVFRAAEIALGQGGLVANFNLTAGNGFFLTDNRVTTINSD